MPRATPTATPTAAPTAPSAPPIITIRAESGRVLCLISARELGVDPARLTPAQLSRTAKIAVAALAHYISAAEEEPRKIEDAINNVVHWS